MGAHRRRALAHRLDRHHRPRRGSGGHRAPRPARLAARARVGGRGPRRADRAGRDHRRRDRAPGLARVLARDGGARDGGARAGPAARPALRPRGGAGPRARCPGTHRRRHPRPRGGGAAARGVLRPVPAAALRGPLYPAADLRGRRLAGPPPRPGLPRRRAVHARRAHGLAPARERGQPGAQSRLRGLRRRAARRHPGAGHAQGLRPEPRVGRAARSEEPGAVREHHVGAGGEHRGARHHRRGAGDGRRGGPGLGRVPGGGRRARPARAARGAHAGRRGVPAAARAARAAPSGHARPLRRGGRVRPPRHHARGASRRARRRDAAAGAHPRLRVGGLPLSGRAPRRARRALTGGARGRAGGRGGAERGGEVDHREAAPALPRPAGRPRAHRGPRPADACARRDPPPHRGGEPGHLSLPRHRGGQPPPRQARRDPRPSWRRRRGPRTRTSSSAVCPRATRRGSGSARSASRGGSGSVSPSPARCCATRPSSSSTRRCPRWTRRARRSCRPRSTG